MSSTPPNVLTLLRAAVGVMGLQSALLAVGVGWLVLNPPHKQASRAEEAQGAVGELPPEGPAAPEEASQGDQERPAGLDAPRRGNQGGRADGAREQTFDTEAEAVQVYLDHLDQIFDLRAILEAGLDYDALLATREAAVACQDFQCQPLFDFVEMAIELGRPPPPVPIWSRGGLAERVAVFQYVRVLARELESASELSDRDDLAPPESALEAARACTTFDCPALETYRAAAELALNAVGMMAPYPPDPENPDARGPAEAEERVEPPGMQERPR